MHKWIIPPIDIVFGFLSNHHAHHGFSSTTRVQRYSEGWLGGHTDSRPRAWGVKLHCCSPAEISLPRSALSTNLLWSSSPVLSTSFLGFLSPADESSQLWPVQWLGCSPIICIIINVRRSSFRIPLFVIIVLSTLQRDCQPRNWSQATVFLSPKSTISYHLSGKIEQIIFLFDIRTWSGVLACC